MEGLFKGLLEKVSKYNPDCDFEMLKRAYRLADNAHHGQLRKSGEPYIIHPLAVANILADLKMDTACLTAALLHDVVEDTSCTYEEIKRIFGDDVALIVEGVTKLANLQYGSYEDKHVENLRKMFLAMAKDIRVVIIKLADRLHNIRTLDAVDQSKRIEKAHETLRIYAPIADRLGIFEIKWELEDLSLKHLDPTAYKEIEESLNQNKQERDKLLEEIIQNLTASLNDTDIDAYISGRSKHYYSIHNKMYAQNKSIDEIYDLFAVRVIVHTVAECYAVLGRVHELYKPIPGRIKDYISVPKSNNYKSLHTTVIGKSGSPFEVQIRTWEMHEVNEKGIAAHWKYKENSKGFSNSDFKFVWVRNLIDMQKESTNAEDFLQNLKIDVFADEVFVFTPKGEAINLPAGATVIDFAYNIHSEIGNKMMGAKINGKIVPIDQTLSNGDRVEIITASATTGPTRDWLKSVKTTQARNKINQWLRKDKKEEKIVLGKEAVNKELKKIGAIYNQLFKQEFLDVIFKKYGYKTLEDLYFNVGHGATTASRIVSFLYNEYKKTIKDEFSHEQENFQIIFDPKKHKPGVKGVIVDDVENCLITLARCCNPIPNDEIIGYVTRGRGVSIHKKACPNILSMSEDIVKNRLLSAHWSSDRTERYTCDIQVLSEDKEGLLASVTAIFADSKIFISYVNGRSTKEKIAILNCKIQVTDGSQLEFIMKKLEKIHGVFKVKKIQNTVENRLP